MPFGQLVIGPAGSGKTTFCNGMQQYLTLLGRKAVVVNLDPANDALPYECAVDIAELVSLQEVQENLNLGPNGGTLLISAWAMFDSLAYMFSDWLALLPHAGLVYCIDYLDSNLDWLQEKLELIQTSRERRKYSGCHSVSNYVNVQPQIQQPMFYLIFLDKWSYSPCIRA